MLQFERRGRKSGESILFALSFAYIAAFLSFWCAGILDLMAGDVAGNAAAPSFLWAATVAMGPLLWWSTRDRDNVMIAAIIEAAQIITLFFAAAAVFEVFRLSFAGMFLCFFALLCAGLLAGAAWEKRAAQKAS